MTEVWTTVGMMGEFFGAGKSQNICHIRHLPHFMCTCSCRSCWKWQVQLSSDGHKSPPRDPDSFSWSVHGCK